MVTAQVNCNTGIDINKKICGLTILERTVLSCYYAGIKSFEILTATDNIAMPESIKKLSDLKYTVKVSGEKPFNDNTFSNGLFRINVSSIINKEYVAAMTGGPEAPNQVYQELTDKSSYRKAQKDLLNSLRKPGEAFSSRWYRHLSLFFTKYLCRTPVTPNMITLFLVFIAAAGGVLIVSDSWYIYYIGLIMQVLALTFDCVDGEIARIKFAFSKNGDWIDSAGDNSCTLFFITAIAIKNHGIHQNETSLILGIAAVSGYVLAVASLFFTLFKTTSSGSLQTISGKVKTRGPAMNFLTTLLKRNIVTPIMVVLGLFYCTQSILIAMTIGCAGLIIFAAISLIKAKAGQSRG